MTTYREQYDAASQETELAVLAAISAAAAKIAKIVPNAPSSTSVADLAAGANNLASALKTIKAN